MNEVLSAERIKELAAPFLEKGFAFEYFYQKGGDSSCVYICRYKKGNDYFDWREVSGTEEIHLVVYVEGEYKFPTVKLPLKKGIFAFFKRLFKKPTMEEKRDVFAQMLLQRLQSGTGELNGIKI